MELRRVAATRYVTPLREGGSVPALVEADDDGLYVLKFHAAAQGAKTLVAEVIAGEIGRRLGLPVPELVIVELDPVLGRSEPDPEIAATVLASGGPNLGMDFLPGALGFDPVAARGIDPGFAARVVWFDAFVTNVDRTVRNPNILYWHREPWLIDNGAALYVHHDWKDYAARAASPFPAIKQHVLLDRASSVADADADLAAKLDRAVFEDIVAAVPGEWLGGPPFDDEGAERAAYVEYLCLRLAARAAFVEEADRARLLV
ncbi:MAG: aminotransferase class I and II [Dehalococcoidia bacterium]|nr:aminotransferase class I and II [Dehalococcoidia bacterium]